VLSSVTAENVELLTDFLNVLPATQSQHERQQQIQNYPEFRIDELFDTQHAGVVAAGLLSKGIMQEGDRFLVGPSPTGEFQPVCIESIHRNRARCRLVQAGQAAALALSYDCSTTLRKGQAIVDERCAPAACTRFEADVYLLYHPSARLCVGFQLTVHIGNVCQTATIVGMNKKHLSTNQSCRAVFEFYKEPEYIHVGSRLLFRERKTKGIGKVTSIQ
jgi:GTPase